MIRERLTLAQCAPGVWDRFGYLRWTPSSCRRCGYERPACTCIGGFAAPAALAPAPAAPVVLTDAMRSALVAVWQRYGDGYRPLQPLTLVDLLEAIRATPGLLPDPAPPPPGTTDAVASLPSEWWA